MSTSSTSGSNFDLQGSVDKIKDTQMKEQVILLEAQTEISTRDKAFQMMMDAIKATNK